MSVMAGRFARRATLVVAGPGFGKTSLLLQAGEENLRHPRGLDLWLTCDRAHGAASLLGPALCDVAGATPGPGMPGTVRAIADAVWRRSPADVAILLDDVHHVRATSSGAALLAALLGALPDNGHLVLASRAAPPLALARLEALGQTAWIEEADLSFTGPEVRDFAASRSVPPESLGVAAGWPALAELAALPRGPGAVRRSTVSDYLREEVLASLSPRRRSDLALLAGLTELDAELAAAAAGHDVALVELLGSLPLVTRSGDRFRLHALWDGALAAGAGKRSRRRARARASVCLAGRGELVEAMRLASEARSWPAMRSVIRAACANGRTPVPADVLGAWFDLVPARSRAEPEGRLLAAVVGQARFEEAVEGYRTAGDAAGELAALAQWNVLAFREGDRATIERLAGRALALAAAGAPGADAHARLGLAMSAFLGGEWAGVLAALEAVHPQSLPRELAAAAAAFRAQALLALGAVSAALEASGQASELAGVSYARLAARTRVIALAVAGRWEDANAVLAELVDPTRGFGWLDGAALDHALAALVCCRSGDLAAARAHEAAARSTATLLDDRAAGALVGLARASCAVLEGDEARARALLRAELAERPLGTSGTHLLHLFNLALLYVLLPETRETWERFDLPPIWATARAIAMTLAAAREGGETAVAETPRGVTDEVLRVHLPAPLAAEFALAARARGLLRNLGRPPLARLRVCLLGPTGLSRDGVAVDHPGWGAPKVRELLAYLAVHRDAPRTAVVADLWPSLDSEAGGNNLRVTLYELRAVLEPGRLPGDRSFFVRSAGGSRLQLAESDHLEVDASLFRRLLDAAGGAGSAAAELQAALAAVDLWQGPCLADLEHAEWAAAPRDELEARFVVAALRAGELVMAHSPQRALDLAGRVLEVDPANERAFRVQAAAYHRQGARTAARRALTRCRRELERLGVEPEPETAILERLIGLTER